MLGLLPYLLIEFVVQTVIFCALLWIMIKIQKLDQHFEFRFVGVLGTAALVTGVDILLDRTAGHFLGEYLASYITVPITSTVLVVCLKKVTGADLVDIIFTGAIAYALMFAVNLFILGSLMGNLRPATKNPDEFETATQRQEMMVPAPSVPQTNPRVAIPPTNATIPSPAKSPEKIAANLSVKGVTRNGAQSAVSLQTESRGYTLFLGESITMQTADGPLPVHFKELGKDWVILEIGGESVKLPVP